MRRAPTTLLLTTLVTLTLAGCGRNPNKPPPGLTTHASIAAKGGLASQPGGTCTLLTTTTIQQTLGGTVSKPTPDTLTPGLDRCTWIITGSNLDATVQLAAYRNNQKPPTVSKQDKNLTAIPQLGTGATWDPTTRTLTWPNTTNTGTEGLQIITTSKEKPNNHAQADLVKLAQTVSSGTTKKP